MRLLERGGLKTKPSDPREWRITPGAECGPCAPVLLTPCDGAGRWLTILERGSGRPGFDLVMLDLDLPKRSGPELLAEIKASPAWRRVPVIVFTASCADEDVARCYELQASCYVPKPVGLHQLAAAVHAVAELWLTHARLPAHA